MLALSQSETVVTTSPEINKRGRSKRKRTSWKTLFRGNNKKIQCTPTSVKRAAVKGARSKAKKASKPDSSKRGLRRWRHLGKV